MVGQCGIGLDAVAQIGRFQHVQALIADPDMIEDLHHLPGETALRKLRRSLHKPVRRRSTSLRFR